MIEEILMNDQVGRSYLIDRIDLVCHVFETSHKLIVAFLLYFFELCLCFFGFFTQLLEFLVGFLKLFLGQVQFLDGLFENENISNDLKSWKMSLKSATVFKKKLMKKRYGPFFKTKRGKKWKMSLKQLQSFSKTVKGFLQKRYGSSQQKRVKIWKMSSKSITIL